MEKEYVNLTVNRTKGFIMALILIATVCAAFISCARDKIISLLMILMFSVCIVGILSLILITQLLKSISNDG